MIRRKHDAQRLVALYFDVGTLGHPVSLYQGCREGAWSSGSGICPPGAGGGYPLAGGGATQSTGGDAQVLAAAGRTLADPACDAVSPDQLWRAAYHIVAHQPAHRLGAAAGSPLRAAARSRRARQWMAFRRLADRYAGRNHTAGL